MNGSNEAKLSGENKMNSKWITAIAISSTLMTSIASAQDKQEEQESKASAGRAREKDQAEDESKQSERLEHVKDAVELTLGMGYSQGFGDVGKRQPSLTDVGNPGGALELGVGYRLLPELAIGVYGSGAMFGRGDRVDGSADLYSATAGIKADWHFLPSRHEFDPWVSLGTGWRGYWVSADQGTSAMHGWQIAKLQAGVDYRVDKAVAISPVIGADLTTFFSQSAPESDGFHKIDSPDVNVFVFAGLQGRFDISTQSGSSSQLASR
jgi:outer membrane protein W